jgi:integrase
LASQKARPRFKIKFTDYAIEKYTSSFIDPITNKTKYRVYTTFDVSRNTILKGLKLCQFEKSKTKWFVLNYWYQQKSHFITIGQFVPGKFGVKQCEDEIYKLAREHQNDKGIWIKNPQLTIKDKEIKIVKAIIVESQKLTINQVIERYVGAGFPRKKGGPKRGSSIKRDCLNLLGHNWRTKHLIFDDVKGKGVVYFKANYSKRTAKPESWTDLFSKFPPGHGILKDNYFNPNNERCVYDSDLGKLVIDELTPGILERYLEAKERSHGTKKAILDSLNSVWLFGRKKGWLGDEPGLNPCRKRDGGIVIEKSDVKADPYKDRRFSISEYKQIYHSLIKKTDQFPFIAEALLLLQFSGLHEEEILRLQKEHVKKELGYIVVPKDITKNEVRDLFIDLTPPVKKVLSQLNKHLSGKYKKYRFVPHLFPTTRIDSKRLHDDTYIRNAQTGLKAGSLRGCFKKVLEENNITGSIKMFRKTFSTIAKIVLKGSDKAIALTGHESEETLDIFYDKTPRDEQRQYAFKVAEVFDFEKASNE